MRYYITTNGSYLSQDRVSWTTLLSDAYLAPLSVAEGFGVNWAKRKKLLKTGDTVELVSEDGTDTRTVTVG